MADLFDNELFFEAREHISVAGEYPGTVVLRHPNPIDLYYFGRYNRHPWRVDFLYEALLVSSTGEPPAMYPYARWRYRKAVLDTLIAHLSANLEQSLS